MLRFQWNQIDPRMWVAKIDGLLHLSVVEGRGACGLYDWDVLVADPDSFPLDHVVGRSDVAVTTLHAAQEACEQAAIAYLTALDDRLHAFVQAAGLPAHRRWPTHDVRNAYGRSIHPAVVTFGLPPGGRRWDAARQEEITTFCYRHRVTRGRPYEATPVEVDGRAAYEIVADDGRCVVLSRNVITRCCGTVDYLGHAADWVSPEED